MKIRAFVDNLKKVADRIPIIARCFKDGKTLCTDISCSFHDDGDDWCEFAFVIKDVWDNPLDTDIAKYILDYNLNAPERKPSFFSNLTQFEDYTIGLTWQFTSGCWKSTDVLDCFVEENDGKMQFVLVAEELPKWTDNNDGEMQEE